MRNRLINIKPIIRVSAVIAAAMLAFTSPATAFATDEYWEEDEIPDSRQKPLLLDDADLLTNSEESQLLNRLKEVSSTWECNVAIVTVDDHDGTAQEFADDYFDYNGFGADYDGAGILFMISMYDREWAISTSGAAIYAFTDYGQEYLVDNLMDDLSEGDYYDAFMSYANTADELLEMYSNGEPLDVGYKPPKGLMGWLLEIALCVVIGLLVALIPVLYMRSQLKTVKPATNAAYYHSSSGVKITSSHDRFTHKTYSKQPIPKESSSGSSGGSSTHTSSSGSTHGGSSGHF